VWGFGFVDRGLGSGVGGWGFGVWGLGFGVWGVWGLVFGGLGLEVTYSSSSLSSSTVRSSADTCFRV